MLDTPDTHGDDTCQPERGKEAGSLGLKARAGEGEDQEAEKGWRSSQSVTRKRKVRAILRQMEEMEHKEEAVKAVNASAWSTKLEGRVLV